MIYLMFLSALALSASAAYYSIAGLVAIFSAAVMPIIIMGGTLEVAKLVVASWLYRNWKEIPLMMKTYFTIALIILMTLTSMGIFGYLSKAHLDQAVPSGDVAAKVALIDEKIKTEKETIDAARQTITQLDSQVNQTITRTANDTTDSGIRRSIGVRKSQARERKDLYNTIETSQAKISSYQEERAPIASQLRKVEAEVGPIKYIAALIYGDNLDSSFLEKAVRIVILMIVSVFDPLAVLMLVAANWSLKHSRKEDPILEAADKVIEWVNTSTDEEFNAALEDEEIPKVIDEPKKDWDPKFDNPIDNDYQEWLDSLNNDVIASPPPPTIEKEVEQLQPKPTTPGVRIKEIEYDSVGRRITP